MYGENNTGWILLLLMLIIMDWIAAISASSKDGTYRSEYGINGIFRSIFILLLPALMHIADKIFNTPGLMFYSITLGLCYHTWQSVTANVYRAGWGKWIPKFILDFVSSEIKAKTERAMGRKIQESSENTQYSNKKEEKPSNKKDK